MSNHFSGPIPSEIGNLSDIGGIYLDGNSLTGPIPTEMARLSNLKCKEKFASLFPQCFVSSRSPLLFALAFLPFRHSTVPGQKRFDGDYNDRIWCDDKDDRFTSGRKHIRWYNSDGARKFKGARFSSSERYGPRWYVPSFCDLLH